MRKDSLEITDADRELICDHVKKSPKLRILIAHGTDTMAEAAKRILASQGSPAELPMEKQLFSPALRNRPRCGWIGSKDKAWKNLDQKRQFDIHDTLKNISSLVTKRFCHRPSTSYHLIALFPVIGV